MPKYQFSTMDDVVIDNLFIIVICGGIGILLMSFLGFVCYFFWRSLQSYVFMNTSYLEDNYLEHFDDQRRHDAEKCSNEDISICITSCKSTGKRNKIN